MKKIIYYIPTLLLVIIAIFCLPLGEYLNSQRDFSKDIIVLAGAGYMHSWWYTIICTIVSILLRFLIKPDKYDISEDEKNLNKVISIILYAVIFFLSSILFIKGNSYF